MPEEELEDRLDELLSRCANADMVAAGSASPSPVPLLSRPSRARRTFRRARYIAGSWMSPVICGALFCPPLMEPLLLDGVTEFQRKNDNFSTIFYLLNYLNSFPFKLFFFNLTS